MRVILILLGLLLMIGGGAVAGAQYAPPDLLKMLDSAPQQARDFLQTPTALYAGAGGAGFGLLLVIIAAVTGGKKKEKPAKVKAEKAKPAKAETKAPEPKAAAPAPKPAPAAAAPAAAPTPKPAPVAPAPAPAAAKAPEPKPAPAPQPAMAAAPRPAPAPAAPEPAKPKPQASAQPPATAAAAPEAGAKVTIADVARSSPLLFNRKRVSDLVTINDALKAYFKKHNAYPVASGLGGIAERGAAWIPGLVPEFVPELPRDPAMETAGPQYVYASDGKDYKLLAQNVSLVGGTSVEVLGVKIDHTRKPTMENASFGYWTPGFAEA